MNISFENPDKVNGLLTITVEEADYQASVEKTLKDYRKKANYPGFRPNLCLQRSRKHRIWRSRRLILSPLTSLLLLNSRLN